MLHSDLFPEFPCDSELIPVEALSTEEVRLLWCSGCGTEFTYKTDCEWVTVVYPGMKSDLGDVTLDRVARRVKVRNAG